jgi:hypothetical protein
MNDGDDTSYIVLKDSWALWLLEDKADFNTIPDSLQQAHMQMFGASVEYTDTQSWEQIVTMLAYVSDDCHLNGIKGVIDWWDECGQFDNEPPELVEINGMYF